MHRFEDETDTTEAQINELLPTFFLVSQVENSVHACRALVHGVKILIGSAMNHQPLRQSSCQQFGKRWRGIDITSSRIDVGFGIDPVDSGLGLAAKTSYETLLKIEP
jgi:hypothetical protein